MRCQIAIAAALACLAPAALAQGTGARNLAASCAICHGTDGRAVTKEVAPLAGLPREQIAGQYTQFRQQAAQGTPTCPPEVYPQFGPGAGK